MASIARKPTRSWERLIPLAVVLLLAAGSWKLARPAQTQPNTNLADSFFPSSFLRMGQTTDQTMQALQTHLKAVPEDWDSYSQLGLAYLQKARETGDPSYYPKAEQAFQKVLGHNPEDYSSVAGMGGLALARHQFGAALDWGERAHQINDSRTYAFGVIADAQIELGRYPEAAQTLQEMVNLRPDTSSYSRISYLRELYGQVDSAIHAMQMAVDAAGEPQLENTAWTRTQLGNLYFNQGDLPQAEYEYKLTLQGYPNYIYALAGMGHVRAAQGKLDEAASYLEKASQIMPIPDILIALGDVYRASGQTAAAKREYNTVHIIQKLYEANGVDLDLEIALFNSDHGYDPAGTLAQAKQAYQRRPSIYGADVLAWALYQSGMYAEAEQYSQAALRLGTRDALKFYHAGMIAFKLGKADQAQEDLKQALAINPNFSLLYAAPAQHTLDELTTGAGH